MNLQRAHEYEFGRYVDHVARALTGQDGPRYPEPFVYSAERSADERRRRQRFEQLARGEREATCPTPAPWCFGPDSRRRWQRAQRLGQAPRRVAEIPKS